MASTAQKAVFHAVDLLCAAGLEIRHSSPSGSYYLAMPNYRGFLRVADHGGVGRGGPIWGRITVPAGVRTDLIDVKMERIIAAGLGYYMLRAAREHVRTTGDQDAAFLETANGK